GADQYVRFGAGGENQLASLGRAVIGADRMDGASRFVCNLAAGGGQPLLPARRNEAFHPFTRQRQDGAPPHAGTAAIDDGLAAPDPQIHVRCSSADETRSCSRLGNIAAKIRHRPAVRRARTTAFFLKRWPQVDEGPGSKGWVGLEPHRAYTMM